MKQELNRDSILSILDECEFENYKFHVGTFSRNSGAYFIQISYEEPDVNTGVMETQRGRKWHVSPHATRSEVVQTAFKAVLTSMEHRAREHFKYQGCSIFGPHFDVHNLVLLCQSKNALEVRVDTRPDVMIRGVDYACEECSELKGSKLDNGFYRCNNCGYPGK